MSKDPKKMTKAADAPKAEDAIADKILKELDRVHVRSPRLGSDRSCGNTCGTKLH